MKNREKRAKRKRDIVKDYLKDKLKNWKPRSDKPPLSNSKNQMNK